jgi:hypothetical protein
MNLKEPERTIWLKELFSTTTSLEETLTVPMIYTGSSNWTFSIDRQTSEVAKPQDFAAYLLGSGGKNIFSITEISPALLGQTVKIDQRVLPLLHSLQLQSPFTIAELEKLFRDCDPAFFLGTRDARGKTLFFDIAINPNNRESVNMIDVTSWMLLKQPNLIHMTDNLGWTVLDRYILNLSSQRVDPLESSMLRLLVSAGAQFNRQVAPRFNLAAEVEKRTNPLFEKPGISKKTLLPPAPK